MAWSYWPIYHYILAPRLVGYEIIAIGYWAVARGGRQSDVQIRPELRKGFSDIRPTVTDTT
jgi:hypothetical protein